MSNKMKTIGTNMILEDAMAALEADPNNTIITREAWSNTDRCIFMRPGDIIPLDIAMKAKSIPSVVKELIHANANHVRCTEYLCEWIDGSILNDLNLDVEDNLADDWIVKKSEILTT